MTRKMTVSKTLTVSLVAALMLGGCGLRGTLKTPPPLWEKAPAETEQEAPQETSETQP
ncbi:MAG: hypothetical protein V3U82_02305 [Robiginitomaculum sp.]